MNKPYTNIVLYHLRTSVRDLIVRCFLIGPMCVCVCVFAYVCMISVYRGRRQLYGTY